LTRAVGDVDRRLQASDANLVAHAEVERALRDAAVVHRRHVPRLAGAAATEVGDLRVHVVEAQGRRRFDRDLRQPWRLAVDRQAHRAEKARLTEIESRQ